MVWGIWHMDKKLLWKIHNWVGLYAGLMIAFLSLTGAAALFRPEVDQLLNPQLTKVQPSPQRASLSKAVKEVLEMHPDKYLFEVELPREHLDSWNIRLRPNEAEEFNPMFWEVFVNPYTGEILGERNYFKTFSYFLRNIHVRFYEANYGRQIVGLIGLALLVSTITGFLIYGKFMEKQSFGKVRRKNMRITQADLHKYIGAAALIFNLMISISGAWLGWQSYIMTAAGKELPNAYSPDHKPLSAELDKRFVLNYDRIMDITQQAFPEMVPWDIRPSTNGDGLIHVLGDVAGQAYERRSNKLVLTKEHLEIVSRFKINEEGKLTKLYYIQEALHFGDFGGMSLKIIYAILAFTSGFLSISGFIIYLERTKKKRQEKPDFIALKPLLIRWTGGMLLSISLIAVLSIRYGIGLPSLLVGFIFYGFIIFYLARAVYLRFISISKHD